MPTGINTYNDRDYNKKVPNTQLKWQPIIMYIDRKKKKILYIYIYIIINNNIIIFIKLLPI